MNKSEWSFYILIIQTQNEGGRMLDAQRCFRDARARYPGFPSEDLLGTFRTLRIVASEYHWLALVQ
jgi:hypothetical protein